MTPGAHTQTAASAQRPPRPKITGVSHLAVYSSDAVQTERFYVHDLGAVKRADPENPAGVRFYFNNVQFVEVLPLPPSAGKQRFDHAAFNTDDADGLRRYLGAHGVVVPAAVSSGSDGSRSFEVRDPEGNRVQFVQPPAHAQPVAEDPLSRHILHVGFIVHDQALEDAFYLGLLGFRPYWHGGMTDDATDWISSQVPDGHDWVEYMKVKGPETSGIPAAMSAESAGVLDHFSLGVANMEQSVNLLTAGDRLTARHSPPQIGRDGKWQLNLYDPDGTRAELMEFQPAVKPCCSAFTAESPVR